MEFEHNVCLSDFNSFAVPASASQMFKLVSVDQLEDLIPLLSNQKQRLILGAGSNVLLRHDFPGLVVINQLKGKWLADEDRHSVIVKIAAGENWHELVTWSIRQGYFGLENLSLIPGTVGAAPIQNIGAYGVELKQYFESLTAIDLDRGESINFSAEQSKFGYRDSVFKARPDRYLITDVSLKLSKTHAPVIDYAGIKEQLLSQEVVPENASAIQISEAVCALRSSKLPSPEIIGNAGSFFKNPQISDRLYKHLLIQHPGIPAYKHNAHQVKIPAAWLIEQCGWKGFRRGDVGVYKNHALVLVNYNSADGEQIWQLATEIQQSVLEKFELKLEPEPRVL